MIFICNGNDYDLMFCLEGTFWHYYGLQFCVFGFLIYNW